MSEKLPQPTATLIKRLRRVAKWLQGDALPSFVSPQERAAYCARANTCWQAAGRLEELDAARAGYERFAKESK